MKPGSSKTADGERPSAAVGFHEWHELKTTGKEGYLRRMMQQGAHSLVRNAPVEARAISVGGHVLPVLVVEPSADNCDLSSPLAHHVLYARDEVLPRLWPVLGWIFRPAYGLFRWLLFHGRIDRVVYFNNWLFSSNACLGISAAELQAVRAFLERRFPNHALVARSVNPSLFPGQDEGFSACGFKLMKARDVFVWLLDDESYLGRNNFRTDSRLLERSKFRFVTPESLDSGIRARLSELYRGLYIEKHNPLNAVLTEQFIESTFETGALNYRFLMDGERILAFYCFEVDRGVYLPQIIGYDLDEPRKSGLYRQVIANIIHEAKTMGLHLSLSAGVDEFKASRGGKSVIEYEAAYFSHLPLRQRLAWRLLMVKCRLSAWLRAKTWKPGFSKPAGRS